MFDLMKYLHETIGIALCAAPSDAVASPADLGRALVAIGLTCLPSTDRLRLLACMMPGAEADEEHAVAEVRRVYETNRKARGASN